MGSLVIRVEGISRKLPHAIECASQSMRSNPWDVRASLLKETGRATGEVALSTYTHEYTRVKINQHTLPASIIPLHILSMLSLRVEPIWFASDLEDAWLVLRDCIPPYDLKPRSLRLAGCLVEASLSV